MSAKTLVVSVMVLAVLTAACGTDSQPDHAAGMGATTLETAQSVDPLRFPRSVLGVTIGEEPNRIVSASASHTEMLYALGVGDRIVATDLFSDYPEEAASTGKIDAFNIGVEGVAAFAPDLVILAFDPGEVVAGLAELGIPAILFDAPVTLDDAFAQMEAVGRAVGADEAASILVDGLRADFDRIVATVPAGADGHTYYHELDGNYFSITSETFIGGMYAAVGLTSIADEADDSGAGYPQLSAEYIVEADPDYIFLADTVCCAQSSASVAERPGWDTLTAVREERVVELDDAAASRWGPRIVDFVGTVVDAVYGGK